jgi:hypothetical protein
MKSEKGVAMKGSIRLVVGFLIVFGAVGGLDNPENPLFAGLALATVGLGLMYSGAKAMERV